VHFVEAGSLSVPGCCQIYESYAETKGSDDSDCRAALIAEFPGSEGEFFTGDQVLAGMIAGPVMFVFSGLLPWACIKVVVNMSRNLHAIREELHELKNRR
jgi:hypothetical protein